MLTEKDYCDYETCVALKELGYIGTSQYFYTTKDSSLRMCQRNQTLTIRTASAIGHTLAIHLYDAQKWLREEKGLFVQIDLFEADYGFRIYDTEEVYYDHYHVVRHNGHPVGSYEESLLAGIKQSVKLLRGE